MTDVQIKSGDLQGLHVSGLDGDKLGTVRECFIDLGRGDIVFLIVEPTGLLGGSGKFHPVPWSAVRFDDVDRVFHVAMTKVNFKASPSYDRDQLANRNHGWDEQANRYFNAVYI